MTEPAASYPIAIEGLKKALKYQEGLHAQALEVYSEIYAEGIRLTDELKSIADKRAQIAREIQSLERQV